MKKIFYTVAVVLITALWVACEPGTESESVGTLLTSADQLQAEVTSVVVNGKNANKVQVKCSSPVVCQWTDGVSTLSSNEGELTLLLVGNQTVTLTAMAADGKKYTKDFSVNVEELAFAVPPEYALFCGSGEKVWTWAPTDCFGNGGDSDTGPAWWILQPADIAEQCTGKNLPADGAGASMKFVLKGKQMIKTSADGATAAGIFDFDMTAGRSGWSIGTLTLTGTNILCGYDFNDAAFQPWTTYDIISLDNNKLVIGAQEHDPNTNYWYWVFNAQ
jgi:hypothetical protein